MPAAAMPTAVDCAAMVSAAAGCAATALAAARHTAISFAAAKPATAACAATNPDAARPAVRQRRAITIAAIFLFAFASSLSLLPIHANAAEPPKAIKILTLEQALEIASEKNRDILKAREYFNWVRGKYEEERGGAFPTVSLNGSAGIMQDKTTIVIPGISFDKQQIYTGGLGVTQTLFTWGKLGAATRAAKEGFSVAQEQLRLYRQAALRDVSTAFFDVLLTRQIHLIAKENHAQKERHLQEATRRRQAGVATDYDVLAASVAVENARPDVIRSENQIRDARRRLSFLLAINGDAGEAIDAAGALESGDIPVIPDYDAVYKTALARRPEILDLRHRINIAHELVNVADAQDKPRLEFKGGYGWKWLETGDLNLDGRQWNAGLYFTFPFFDGLSTRGKVAQSESELRSIKIDEEKLADALSLQSHEALNAVRESKEIVDALSGTVAQAEKLLYLSEKGYELGVKIRLEVEDAELKLQQARGNLSRAWRDYRTALVNLQWVMGVIGEGKL
jgi:HAE1 family hydrophobic/amphiphilic exporter-1